MSSGASSSDHDVKMASFEASLSSYDATVAAKLAICDVVYDTILNSDASLESKPVVTRTLVEAALKLLAWLHPACEAAAAHVRQVGGLLVVGTGMFESKRVE